MASHQKGLQLVKLLADGQFHSGEHLAQALGISRAAVWKQLRRFPSSLGLEVESVRGKGYRLRSELELLERDSILSALDQSVREGLRELQIHHTVESTNSWLMSRAREGAAGGTVCLAERQTTGRGRHGRDWVSPFGNNIYLSILWRYSLAPSELSGLSLACGVAVARALSRVGVGELALKWPNDVLWERCKLAGLLLEVGGEATGPSHVVVGVGINTHLDRNHAVEIDQPWIDLAGIPDVAPRQRNRLAAYSIAELIAALEWYGRDGLGPFIGEWRRYDHFLGEEVVLAIGLERIRGSYRGITESGAIRLKVSGKTRTYNVGEVNLIRPIV